MALTRAWLFGGDLSTAMKNPVVRDHLPDKIEVAFGCGFAKKWFIRSAFHDELALGCLPEYFGEAHHRHRAG